MNRPTLRGNQLRDDCTESDTTQTQSRWIDLS